MNKKYFCQCGCREEVKSGNKFVNGHQRRGQKHSEEAKRKIAFAKSGKDHSGENNPHFGKKHSEETKTKISIAKSGENCSLETRRKISIVNTGKIRSEETKAKISSANSGENCSLETRRKISIAKIGENNPNWQGGITNEPYGPGNDEQVKEKIRIRDNHTCQECGVIWDGIEKKFHPHHIDYDKNNHVSWNRITLCPSCHSKTNTNREYWMNHFYEKNFKVCVQRIFMRRRRLI